MKRDLSEIFPIALTPQEANQILEHSELRSLADPFAKEILGKEPTPLEAQAVLVAAWAAVLRNARFSIPKKEAATGQFQSQT